MITVCGESLVDIVIDAEGDSHEEVGGSPLNVAVGLARLDVPAYLITQTGHDARGGRVVDHVTANGVELLSSHTRSGRTSTARARISTGGEATYDFDVEWSLAPQELPHCDALHVGSLAMFLEPGRESVLDLVDQAYGRGVFISLDPNLRTNFVDDLDAAWRDVEVLAERATLVRISSADIELVHPGADPEDIARSLLAGERTELVVLTHGQQGASAYVEGSGTSTAHVGPAPLDEGGLIDSVGAGDAFTAAVLTILLEGAALDSFGPGLPSDEASLVRLLTGASEVAAATCSRRGASPPLRSELRPGWPD